MKYIFMDEKGPQNSFKISKPFDKVKKLSYGDDNMHVYVVDAIMFDDIYRERLYGEYSLLEKQYAGNRQGVGELKASKILKGKRFRYGIASLKKNDFKFYDQLFDLLRRYKVENLSFSISKAALIVDSRLNNWILSISESTGTSALTLKYILTKYVEIECSEEVLNELLDKSVKLSDVLESIKKDLGNIIEKNLSNARMEKQLLAYQQLQMLISMTNYEYVGNLEPDTEAVFNWKKVVFPMDLWLLEKECFEEHPQISLYLDEGIPKEPFTRLGFGKIIEGNDSRSTIGLRISDMLVVFIGKYLSQLSADIRYDMKSPDKPKHLPSEWFSLSEEQFKLVRKAHDYVLGGGMYSYGLDTFFDDGALFEGYLRYINNYKNYGEYSNEKSHPKNFTKQLITEMNERFKKANENEVEAIKGFGSLKNAIEEGIFHPL